jgi:hypothetical protein
MLAIKNKPQTKSPAATDQRRYALVSQPGGKPLVTVQGRRRALDLARWLRASNPYYAGVRVRPAGPTAAARRNWRALVRCIKRAFGFVPEELRLEYAGWFTGRTRRFPLVEFRADGPPVEAEFRRHGRRWRCTQLDYGC